MSDKSGGQVKRCCSRDTDGDGNCDRHPEKGLAMTAPETAPKPEKPWLVWNTESRVYWGADRCGYRADVAAAGRYTLDEALDCCRMRSKEHGKPHPEVLVPSPEYVAYLRTEQLAGLKVGALVEALGTCAVRFREYEALHRKKAPIGVCAMPTFGEFEPTCANCGASRTMHEFCARALQKADANAAMAEMCEKALPQPSEPGGDR